jgi:predicted DNA-binding transcriptional regulator YafY
MSDTPARLLRLLSLLQARPDWRGSELAARLDVSARTVRNDIARLRDLGYPVDATPGVAGGYRMAAGAAIPPLLLDDDEAVAVVVGLRTAASTTIAGIEETSLRALTKLEQVLPNRVRRRVNALHTHLEMLQWGTPHTLVDPEALALFSQACRDREQLRFDYADRQGVESRRLVEPYRLVADGHRWYLIAWDVRRDDWRTFRVDRTSRPRLAGVRAPRRELPAADAATYLREAIASRPPTHQAVVTLHASVEEVRAAGRSRFGEPEALDDRSCRLHCAGDSLEWLALRIVMLGVDFTVESPPELIDYLRAAAARITRATPS